MTHSLKQIHCCHWDLGRFTGVCGEALGGLRATGSLQGTPTVVMDRQFLPGAVTAEVLEKQLAELGRSK
jgi:hypothetical protein